MGSAMTGNVLNSAFGGEAADKLLVRTTAILAALFMIFAISLNVISTPGSIDVSTSTSDPILDRNKLEDIEPIINVPIEVEETE
jgi:preprotein translocase subunit SecG